MRRNADCVRFDWLTVRLSYCNCKVNLGDHDIVERTWHVAHASGYRFGKKPTSAKDLSATSLSMVHPSSPKPVLTELFSHFQLPKLASQPTPSPPIPLSAAPKSRVLPPLPTRNAKKCRPLAFACILQLYWNTTTHLGNHLVYWFNGLTQGKWIICRVRLWLGVMILPLVASRLFWTKS